MKSGIYEVECLTNGKKYVGSSVNFVKRWSQHRRHLEEGRHHSRILQRAWNRYGQSAFRFKKLLICSKENLLMYEQILLDNIRPEFNCYKTAGSPIGNVPSQETREKIRAALTTPEARARMSALHKGVPKQRSAQHQVNLGVAHRLFSDEQVRSIRASVARGRTRTSLAAELNCSLALISNIASGKSYGWVES